MTVYTDQPGVQFYTGNFLDGTIHGKGGKVYTKRGAFCLETQHYPDSPNEPQLPDDGTEAGPGVPLHDDRPILHALNTWAASGRPHFLGSMPSVAASACSAALRPRRGRRPCRGF